MFPRTEQMVKDAIYYHNQNSDYRKFALQHSRDRVALISSDKESGGLDVKVCISDEFLEAALVRGFGTEDGTPRISVIEDVFYSLAIERWHARLWE